MKDGIIIINKEKNYTSRDIVNIVSKELNTKKVGHTGTLDPNAEGVLVLCINKALKIAELITANDKEYIAKVRLGYETDTLDNDGKITLYDNNNINITKKDVMNCLEKFKGKINQTVPMYSSIKINGKKLYEYARNNEKITPPTREVTIYNIELISDVAKKEKYYEFNIKCKVSKGTYIRSLVRDIGYALNTYATMIELKRIKQGKFKIEDSNSLNDIKNNNYKLYKIEEVLDINKIILTKEETFKAKNGQKLNKVINQGEKVLLLDESNNLIAIYQYNNETEIKPWKVFN